MNVKNRALELLRIGTRNREAQFRDDQWEAIHFILRRKRLLLVEATGWGKSYVYFIATRILRESGKGLAILISPLLSLMRNQLDAARRMGIHAATINSSNPEEWENIYQELSANKLDMLLVSPERLSNSEFLKFLRKYILKNLSFLIVDEAHCISDWGHDFRPDYQRIKRIITFLPSDIPVLATTATANDRVVKDIKDQLRGNLIVMRGVLMRNSICLQNKIIADPFQRIVWLTAVIRQMHGSGIVYVLTRRYCDIISEWLRTRGINAVSYHAGIEGKTGVTREELENRFQKNEIKVLVATVALGMGYDKPDISFVIHFHRPASVVHYYQQVGRAGRALDQAYGILLQGDEDDDINSYFIERAYPVSEQVRLVLDILESYPEGLSRTGLKLKVNLRDGEIDQVLKILSVASPSPVTYEDRIYYRNGNPYHYPIEKVLQLKRLRYQEQATMVSYMKHDGCLMRFLAAELDDPYQNEDCGKCCNCRQKDIITADIDHNEVIRAEIFIRQKPIWIFPRKIFPHLEGITTYSKIPYYLEKNGLMLEWGRVLCRYRDPGLGKLVSEGKYKFGRFSDKLVKESHELIIERWFPEHDFPLNWVTCIPSNNHPELVPDFAKRLAAALKLPFVPIIKSTGLKKQEQKTMNNNLLKLLNLDGEYEIDKKLLKKGNVLIVDDMVESGWTLNLAGILLKTNGFEGKVFPFALASTREL